MKLQLSITIVAYHNYEQIKTSVMSIENYTNPNIKKKIYISDNSIVMQDSDMEKQSDFKKFLAGYEDVEYIANNANIGFGRGHNKVIDSLESEYHAIVNPDIEINEDVFSSILSYMDAEGKIGMVIPKIIDQNGEIQAAYREYPTVFDVFVRVFAKSCFKKRQKKHTLQDKDYDKPFEVPFAQGCFLVIRTELFKKLGGFDDRYFMYLEDADLCRRVNVDSRVMYYPGASVMHAWEKGSHKKIKLMYIHLQSMIRYFNKWGWEFF